MATTKPSARERLLDAADELFYGEGVHTVGIDRVIEHAGVAKATLYSAYGSKDDLILAYLGRRRQRREERITRHLAQHDNPRDKILSVFDAQAEVFNAAGYQGCAFYNASAEGPSNTAVSDVCQDIRGWTRRLFLDLATELGAPDPEALSRQLVLLYDGANVAAKMDRRPEAALEARTAAALLLDAAARPS
jgi:AcrR family transcriptional regulator